MNLEDLEKQAEDLKKEDPKAMTVEQLEAFIARISNIIDKSEENLNNINEKENERNN
jgi:hypothetical protein